MKITPDYKGRNDEYDNNTVRFYESIDDNSYFYELYVLIDGKKAAVIVTNSGVSVDYLTGESVHTNIVPERLYGKRKSLKWKHLSKILEIIESTNGEGKIFSKQDMNALYEKWKSLGEP